jgi:hypothetical protein
MFTLSRDLVVTALEEIEQKEEEHYNIECLRCRHTIKVPRTKLERMRPRDEK